jgi:cytochrome c553
MDTVPNQSHDYQLSYRLHQALPAAPTAVAPGTIKYLRVLEQIPRPWGARRTYTAVVRGGRADEYDQQHAVVTKDTHLGLKVQHGIVTVEADGSARFVVPAGRNIFLQALDANYRAVQTERTYVNYMPGEVRSCVGCHESTAQSPGSAIRATPIAMKRKAEVPFAQPGETAPRTLSYARDVQPVWDKHCVSCHNDQKAAGKLNLSGTITALFNTSYENLVPERRRGRFDRGLLGPVMGENHPKQGNIHYLPARSVGSYASVLVAMFAPDIQLADSDAQARAAKLARSHAKIKLSSGELLKISNWVDTNAQYYGTYYGRRTNQFVGYPDFRAEYTVAQAQSPEAPEVPEKE